MTSIVRVKIRTIKIGGEEEGGMWKEYKDADFTLWDAGFLWIHEKKESKPTIALFPPATWEFVEIVSEEEENSTGEP